MFVKSFDLKAERRCEILFVADHHIDKRREFTIHRNRFFPCRRLSATTNRDNSNRRKRSCRASSLLRIASRATAGVVSDSAQKIPPV